jgi:integrase/recombinase XerD
MPLTIYRRHKESCPRREEPELRIYVDGDLFVRKGDEKKRGCRCVLWLDGLRNGQEIRESLKTRDWEKAKDLVRARESAREASGNPTEADPISIVDAAQKYIADAEARKLREETVKKYKRLFNKLEIFAGGRGIYFLPELGVDQMSAFRSSWKLGPRTSVKELERLRAFFDFARDREWVRKNPAMELKAPKPKPRPTMPFTHQEMIRLLAALELYAKSAGIRNAQRLRAFVLLLRYSGMRIGDTVGCGIDRITKNRLFLYTQKTGEPVCCILPDFVVQALEAAPRTSEGFYFWSGKSKLRTAVGKWQRRLQRLFALAKVAHGHAHRFRDTFAVELLLAGVPIERVSVLLAHQSIRVTERHYAPWTRSRQDQLEADLTRAWSQDPVVLEESLGTNQVQTARVRQLTN